MDAKELYSVFMDSQIIGFEINYSDYLDNRKNIKISVQKNSNTKTVEFYYVKKLIFVEEEFHQYYIEDMKCIKLKNELIYLCLDPYDGRLNKIEEEDNFVITFEEFKILGWKPENQADKYYELIKLACTEILKNSKLRKEYVEIRRDLFEHKINKDIIFYHIIGDNEIEVIRILHQSMDLEKRLSES